MNMAPEASQALACQGQGGVDPRALAPGSAAGAEVNDEKGPVQSRASISFFQDGCIQRKEH